MTSSLLAADSPYAAGARRQPPCTRERRPLYPRPALRERELSRLWELQQLPPEALVTGDGRELRIVFRGRRGRGPGPDFRDAIVAFDGSPVQGDIELHLRASDFFHHGHSTDRAYQRLVLHVVYHDDCPVRLEDGRLLPVVALERWVARRAGVLRATLTGPEEYREPCHQGVAERGGDASLAVLRALGEERLRERAARLGAAAGSGPAEECLYLAVARALGLTRNAEAMTLLAKALPLGDLRAIAGRSGDPLAALDGALLGAAGLLDGQLALWPGDDAALLAAWRAAGSPAAADITWAPGPYRGVSAPRERVSGLARLVERAGPPLSATLAEWHALLAAGPLALLRTLQVPRFIGRDRAIEIAVNAVLPWLLAVHGSTLEQAVFELFAALPAPQPYGINTVIMQALDGAGDTAGSRGAAVSQGALQLTRDWCTRGGCGRCPLSPTAGAAFS